MKRLPPEFSLRALRAAAGFLTVLPVLPKSYPGDLLPRSAIFFPLVGVVVGAIGGGVLYLGCLFFPPHLAAAAALLATIALTGALHEDGLADSADGLFGGRSPERRIEIMRDSRIGTFGAVALFFSLIIRWSAVTGLVHLDLVAACIAMILAHGFGRLASVVVAAVLDPPPGSPDHKSGRFIGEFPLAVAFPSLLLLTIAGFFAFPWQTAVAASVTPLAITLFLVPLFKKRLGGVNGDCLGAANQLVEIGYWLAIIGTFGVLSSVQT